VVQCTFCVCSFCGPAEQTRTGTFSGLNGNKDYLKLEVWSSMCELCLFLLWSSREDEKMNRFWTEW
jgi:hypothetical protein